MTATSFLKYKQGGRHEPNKQFNGSQAAGSGQLLKLAMYGFGENYYYGRMFPEAGERPVSVCAE